MAQSANRVITVSHAMQEDLVRHGWPAGKISVVWNGVDPEKYNPQKYERYSNPKKLSDQIMNMRLAGAS
jgi:glycosyltransferase involved in cell wall biosynthesis